MLSCKHQLTLPTIAAAACVALAGCNSSTTTATQSNSAEHADQHDAFALAASVFGQGHCHDQTTPPGEPCIREVIDLGSVMIREQPARVLIVKRVIPDMQAPRGMNSVEVVTLRANRLASFQIEHTSAVTLEDTGLLRIGSLLPIQLTDLTCGTEPSPDLIAKTNAAEWSKQAVSAAMDAYVARGLGPMLNEPLPTLLSTAADTYWHQGLDDSPIIRPSAGSDLPAISAKLPQRIVGYEIEEILAADVEAPSLRYSKYWESTIRVRIWEVGHEHTPMTLEFAVQGDHSDSDLISNIRMNRALR